MTVQPTLAADATFDFEATQVRLILGGASGTGVLHFKGQDHPFTMKAVTVGGAGVTAVDGTGTVEKLTKVEDFAGKYAGVGIGAAAVKGQGASKFQNEKGVVVTTVAKSTGAALNLGASGLPLHHTPGVAGAHRKGGVRRCLDRAGVQGCVPPPSSATS